MVTRLWHSPTTDPYLNLAIEDWLFRELPPEESALFLWRNSPTVVIGRYQNPWVECRVDRMESEGVQLARRQSGGGAVFHDLGNTNFTFLSSRERYDQDTNFATVIATLARLGVRAERTARNDIVVEGRKVSGNAFRHLRERSFHHGTLLVEADLERLTGYLTPSIEPAEAKGIKSVRSRVANLREFAPRITHDLLVEAFAAVVRGAGVGAAAAVDVAALLRDRKVQEYLALLSSWEWLYGNTPDFVDAVADGGAAVVRVEVHRGRISAMTPAVAPQLIGQPYDPHAVRVQLEATLRE